MTNNRSLFGQYVRSQGKYQRGSFRKYQITRPLPNSTVGRVPSAASQRALYHADDFNGYWRVSAFNTLYKKPLKPFTTSKEVYSSALGNVGTMRVTPSALYAIDDKGGFDNYIARASPEELRSNTGEKLREVLHMHRTNPSLLKWGLAPKSLFRRRDRLDPMYTRFRNASYHRAGEQIATSNSYSPYFLPNNDSLFPERSRFHSGNAPSLDLWWKAGIVVERNLKHRLGEAKSFEEAHPDHRNGDSFRKGHGAGGGGGQGSPRPRSKTYRSRQSRPF